MDDSGEPRRLPDQGPRLATRQFSIARLLVAFVAIAVPLGTTVRTMEPVSYFLVLGGCWGFAIGALRGGLDMAFGAALLGAAASPILLLTTECLKFLAWRWELLFTR